MKNIAIIPARSGSKRIKGKNIRLLGGKPLIYYSIEQALKSEFIDKIIISTDISELTEIVEQFNSDKIEILWRNKKLAGDYVTTEDVLINVSDNLQNKYEFESVVTLLPTSPFRNAELIDRCIKLFNEKNADAVLTIRRSKLKIGTWDKKSLKFRLMDKKTPAAMHQLKLTAYDNPSVYVTKVSVLRERKFILGENNYAIEVNKIQGLDINDEIDWAFAEALIDRKIERY